jgi:hypothetical protein
MEKCKFCFSSLNAVKSIDSKQTLLRCDKCRTEYILVSFSNLPPMYYMVGAEDDKNDKGGA